MLFRLVFAVFLGIAATVRSVQARPVVVVSIAPLHSAVSAVMEGAGTPELLLKPAVSVHDYQLKPSDMRRLAGADILFQGGETLETFLQKPLETAGLKDKTVSFLTRPEIKVYPVRGAEHAEPDGHFWLDPDNMAAAALVVAEKLSALDGENAALYKENAGRFAQRMRDLKEEGRELLRPYARKPYVTFHDAYQYFEKSFGLTPLGFVFADGHHAAGAAKIGALREKIKNAGQVCLFAEPQFSDKRLKVVAENLPVVHGTLDPAGVGLTPSKDFYADLMQALFDSFVRCFSAPAE